MYQFLWQRMRRRVIILILVSVVAVLVLSCVSIVARDQAGLYSVTEPGTGVTIHIEASGTYTIAARRPSWIFGGNVGHALSHITVNQGTDRLGPYQEIAFSYQGQVARISSIRAYADRPVVLFSTTYLAASNNEEPFPTFTTYPTDLYHLSYRGQFGVYGFDLNGLDSPWLFFDAHANSFMLSPAANFMVANMVMNSNGSISSGINHSIDRLPQNFSHSTMLTLGTGINSVYDTWGHAMTDLQGKVRPGNDADVTLNTLGYWTDNGAYYYYKYIPTKGYEGTLEAIKKNFKQQGIPLGYMQLDSWWYPKGSPPNWRKNSRGINTYTADPTLFPDGLGVFQQRLGLPLVVHARWIDQDSPYRSQYKMSGNVSVDPAYWNSVMNYIRSNGAITYEQDWLSAQAQTANNLTDPNAFMNDMAHAASVAGLALQYCMPYPRHYLQGSMYSNLLTTRVSHDRFLPARWDSFLYDSRFASALGIWPWTDVFMSTETNNLLLSTLSAGMVGVGDRLGKENKANLMQTIRSDGVIVKPDTSIVPTDETYVGDAQAQGTRPAMVAAAYTYHASMVAAYVFAYSRINHVQQPATFTPATLGISGDAYVYNYFAQNGTVVKAGQSFTGSVKDGSYYVVVPIGRSGIAFLGDEGKFASLGSKRISRLSDDGIVHATVTFAPGEGAVTLHGYAPAKPTISVTSGSAGSVSYNTSTHLFSFSVEAGETHTAVISMSL